MTAGLFLVLSLPFLVWFIWTHWPARGSPDPLPAPRGGSAGLPPRIVPPGRVVGRAERRSRWRPRAPTWWSATPPRRRLRCCRCERVRAVYPSTVPGGTQVVILLNDGSWTTMQVPPGEPRANRALALTLSERAQFARASSAGR